MIIREIHGLVVSKPKFSCSLQLENFFLTNYFLFLAALGLCCCPPAFSSCREQGLLSSYSLWASHCGDISYCRAQTLGCAGF